MDLGSLPMRNKYATDSASMLARARHLIEAAKTKEELEAQGRKAPTRNPFRKPWGSKKTGASGNLFGKQYFSEEQQTRTSER